MALDGFKDGTYRVLVATDIAARGIDVAEIGHVVNFDLPHVPEDYVHRVGRTARMEASGRASTFTSPEEKDLLVAIEKLTRAAIPRADVPRETETFQAEVARGAEARASAPPAHSGRPGAGHGRGRSGAQPRRERPASGGRGHGARPAAASSGGSERTIDMGGAARSAGAKPRSVGSWGGKRRR